MRGLYYDTDSVVFVYDPNGYNLRVGCLSEHLPEKHHGDPRFNVLGTLRDEMGGLCGKGFCGPSQRPTGTTTLPTRSASGCMPARNLLGSTVS